MRKISWRIFGHFLNLSIVLLICWVLSSVKANSAAPVADPVEGNYIDDDPMDEVEGLNSEITNIEETIDNSDLNNGQAVEDNGVEPEPLPEGFTNVPEVEESPAPLSSDAQTVSENKKSAEAVMDEDGKVVVNDRPAVVPVAPEPEDDNSIVEEKFDEADFLADEEGEMDNLNAEVMKDDPQEDLQGSPLREFDIKSDLQNSPLRQYDIKSDLQSSPLLKYELKFSGKEANTATEKGRSFGEYDQNKMAPKFKGMKAPYNKASKQGSIVEEKYEK